MHTCAGLVLKCKLPLVHLLTAGLALLDHRWACRRGTVLQLAGAELAGKSLLCMLTTISFILPPTFANVALGGLAGATQAARCLFMVPD